jgi:hypothetical protein
MSIVKKHKQVLIALNNDYMCKIWIFLRTYSLSCIYIELFLWWSDVYLWLDYNPFYVDLSRCCGENFLEFCGLLELIEYSVEKKPLLMGVTLYFSVFFQMTIFLRICLGSFRLSH